MMDASVMMNGPCHGMPLEQIPIKKMDSFEAECFKFISSLNTSKELLNVRAKACMNHHNWDCEARFRVGC